VATADPAALAPPVQTGSQPVAAGRLRSTVLRTTTLALAIVIFGLSHIYGSDLMSGAIVIGLAAAACRGRGGLKGWLTIVVAMQVFLEARALVPRLGIPPHSVELQHAERVLFLGAIPSETLQHWLFSPGHLGPIDWLAVGVHWSYFFFPYAILLAIWVRSPQTSHHLARLLAFTLLAGVVVYALYPATPPWLAAAEPGGPSVYRVMKFAGTSLNADTYDQIYRSIGDPNPVAAMPSLHFAITFMVFLYALGSSRTWSLLAATYAGAMAFALVYLGEHYVIDLLAGGMMATGIWWLYRRRGGLERA
jgi:membrane-associated phospholipid phosphatase